MALWLIFGEMVLGRVEAPHRDAAEAAACQRFGHREVRRVQSEASYKVAEDERNAAQQRRLLRPSGPA